MLLDSRWFNNMEKVLASRVKGIKERKESDSSLFQSSSNYLAMFCKVWSWVDSQEILFKIQILTTTNNPQTYRTAIFQRGPEFFFAQSPQVIVMYTNITNY